MADHDSAPLARNEPSADSRHGAPVLDADTGRSRHPESSEPHLEEFENMLAEEHGVIQRGVD